MKKVLLTTTALTLAAGVASAEITLSGKTEAGVIRTGTTAAQAATTTSGAFTYYDASLDQIVEVADGSAAVTLATGDIVLGGTNGTDAVAAGSVADSFTVYSGIDINMAASATASNGYTYSIAADIGGGSIADWFPYILAVAVFLFAFSTMISWSYYGERCWVYLFGDASSIFYKILFLIFTFLGSIITATNILDFSDLMILGMAFPNILGLVILSGVVKKDLNHYLKSLPKS